GMVENPARPRISAPHIAATTAVEGPARGELTELGPERTETGMGCSNGKDRRLLQNNPLDLIERDLVVAAIVELGRARAFVRSHLLRVLDETAIDQIDGDAGRPEAVAAEPSEQSGLFGTANDHAPCVLARHARAGEPL